jgi:predicted helicase
MFPQNSERVIEQRKLLLRVIMGNPILYWAEVGTTMHKIKVMQSWMQNCDTYAKGSSATSVKLFMIVT